MPAFKVEIHVLFGGTQVVLTRYHGRFPETFRGSVARGANTHSSKVPRIQILRMIFPLMIYYAIRNFRYRYRCKQFSRTLPIIRRRLYEKSVSQIIGSLILRCMRSNVLSFDCDLSVRRTVTNRLSFFIRKY